MSKIFKFCSIYCMLIKFDIMLRFKGFINMFSMYVKKYEDMEIRSYPKEEIEKTNIEIFEVFRILELACSLYPANAKCIHKSFLLYRFLRDKYKIPVKLVIGVCQFPFEAHAWVMQGQYNLFEEDTFINRYKIILDSSSYFEGECENEVVSRSI